MESVTSFKIAKSNSGIKNFAKNLWNPPFGPGLAHFRAGPAQWGLVSAWWPSAWPSGGW